MDRMRAVLEQHTRAIDDESEFSLEDNGHVTVAKAKTGATFSRAVDAFAAAQRLVSEVLRAEGYVAVNHTEIGAEIDPFSDAGLWRGTFRLVLDVADTEHRRISGLTD